MSAHELCVLWPEYHATARWLAETRAETAAQTEANRPKPVLG